MEAPTFVSLVDVFVQPVDIPVGAGGGSGCGGHQGFLSGQSSSPSVEQIVDIPVAGRWSGFGGRQGVHPGQSSTAVAEQNVDIPAPRGGLQGFPPEQGPALFPGGGEKRTGRSAPGVGTGCGLQLIHAGGSSRRLLG